MSYRNFISKNEDLSKTAQRIKKLRERAKESQDELAKAIHCTKHVISNIEQDKSQPSIKTVKDIARHYKVSADYICGLSEDMTIPSNVLDCLCRHISLEKKIYGIIHSNEIPVISISKSLFEYLETLVKIERLKKAVPDEAFNTTLENEFINPLLEAEAEKAKNSLRSEKDDTVKYALLSTRYIASDEVLRLLEKSYNESEGDDGPL